MNTLANVSIAQLKRAITIREQIESLSDELNQILGGEISLSRSTERKGRKKVSAAGRARMREAQQARWARVKGANMEKVETAPKRRMSAAGRAAISAAAKARWKKAKAAGKTRL